MQKLNWKSDFYIKGIREEIMLVMFKQSMLVCVCGGIRSDMLFLYYFIFYETKKC